MLYVCVVLRHINATNLNINIFTMMSQLTYVNTRMIGIQNGEGAKNYTIQLYQMSQTKC